LKALTLTAPWGTLISLGAKTIETRSWSTSYRGPLAIHQGSNLKPVGGKRGLWELVWHPPFRDVLAEHAGSRHMDDILAGLPRGVIVAVCDLVGCYPTARTDGGDEAYVIKAGSQHKYRELVPVWGNERTFGDYSLGRFAWVLVNVRALPEPIPMRGQLGLWELHDALLPPTTATP
jgi:activating signal cointegrator 1